MQGGEQGSLWQQSDLLDLVASTSPESTALPLAESAAAAAPADTAEPAAAAKPPGDPLQPDTSATDSASSRTTDAAPASDTEPGSATALSATTVAPHEPPDAASLGNGSADDPGTFANSRRVANGQAIPAPGTPDSQPGLPEDRNQERGTAGRPGGKADSDTGETGAGAGGRWDGSTQVQPHQAEPTPASSERPSSLPQCPERLLILDTETTALSPQQGQCIEVGAVLFDVASRSVLMQVSFLMPCASNPAEHVNGIPAAVSRLQQPWRSGLACFEAMVAGADALLAHNAAFDRQWFGSGDLPALDKPWICSMEDIRWPTERQLRATPSVRDLALAYGVPVWAAHRALTDCIYLVQVFQRCDQLEALLQAALEPRRLVRARLSYDERQLAKDAGFRWNEPVPKAWSRRLSEREIAALPFAVDPVEAEEPGRQPRKAAQALWRRSA